MYVMASLQKQLEEISRQIADYKRHVADQEAKIAKLSAKGSAPQDAVDLLKQFKETLRVTEHQRDFLRRKLRGEA
jgi:hypothetical protein